MKKFSIIFLILIFSTTATTFAEENIEPIIGNIVKEKIFSANLEGRFFASNLSGKVHDGRQSYTLNTGGGNASEFIFTYKNFSADYVHSHGKNSFAQTDIHYTKLSIKKSLISLMGSEINFNYGVTGTSWRGSKNISTHKKTQNYFVVVPVAGIGLQIRVLPKADIYSQISGLPLGGHGHIYDFEAGFRYSPQKDFSLTAGFRKIDANFNLNDEEGNFKMNGPFFGMRLNF